MYIITIFSIFSSRKLTDSILSTLSNNINHIGYTASCMHARCSCMHVYPMVQLLIESSYHSITTLYSMNTRQIAPFDKTDSLEWISY